MKSVNEFIEQLFAGRIHNYYCIEVLLGIVGAVAAVASTGYSAYSSEQGKKEATSQEHKMEKAAALEKQRAGEAAQKKKAALYSQMRAKRGGREGTLLTSGSGVTEEASTVGGALRSTLGGA